MPCRVGITTDPDERKRQWENKVIGLRNWRIIGSHSSKAKAQEQETSYAERNNCKAHAGGPDKGGTWYVYRFDYTREK